MDHALKSGVQHHAAIGAFWTGVAFMLPEAVLAGFGKVVLAVMTAALSSVVSALVSRAINGKKPGKGDK